MLFSDTLPASEIISKDYDIETVQVNTEWQENKF
jgi:hypothetical protein